VTTSATVIGVAVGLTVGVTLGEALGDVLGEMPGDVDALAVGVPLEVGRTVEGATGAPSTGTNPPPDGDGAGRLGRAEHATTIAASAAVMIVRAPTERRC
jgi:hypothetical protein